MYCWAQYPWVFFVSLAVTSDSPENPFAKTPFAWFLTKGCLTKGCLNQDKTPWVGQSCADCLGFLVLGAGDAPPPELHPGASVRAPGLAFAFMALRASSWICCPQLPYHPFKNGTHSTCFCGTRGHTPNFWSGHLRVGWGSST